MLSGAAIVWMKPEIQFLVSISALERSMTVFGEAPELFFSPAELESAPPLAWAAAAQCLGTESKDRD